MSSPALTDFYKSSILFKNLFKGSKWGGWAHILTTTVPLIKVLIQALRSATLHFVGISIPLSEIHPWLIWANIHSSILYLQFSTAFRLVLILHQFSGLQFAKSRSSRPNRHILLFHVAATECRHLLDGTRWYRFAWPTVYIFISKIIT